MTMTPTIPPTTRPAALSLAVAAALLAARPTAAFDDGPAAPTGEVASSSPASLEETKVLMGKWIETQQIIAKERTDWQQGKEILAGRIKLVGDEIAALEAKIAAAKASLTETQAKRDELVAEGERLKATTSTLAESVAAMESDVRGLLASTPDPVLATVRPIADRMPTAQTVKEVSAAERFQNVLGILNELAKANNDIAVRYETHTLSDGRTAEVQAIYLGLAQAYFVSATGEAGIGRPTPRGWTWQESKAIGRDVLTALEIIQGKHTPAFVPVPVTIR